MRIPIANILKAVVTETWKCQFVDNDHGPGQIKVQNVFGPNQTNNLQNIDLPNGGSVELMTINGIPYQVAICKPVCSEEEMRFVIEQFPVTDYQYIKTDIKSVCSK